MSGPSLTPKRKRAFGRSQTARRVNGSPTATVPAARLKMWLIGFWHAGSWHGEQKAGQKKPCSLELLQRFIMTALPLSDWSRRTAPERHHVALLCKRRAAGRILRTRRG
jgi:hypothetical protein